MRNKTFLVFIIFYFTEATYIGASDILDLDPSICSDADPNELVYIPYPGDCTKFIECSNQVPTVFDCSDGLWWHPEVSACDYPGSYCSETTTTKATTTTTTRRTTTTTPTTTTTKTTTTTPTTTTTTPTTTTTTPTTTTTSTTTTTTPTTTTTTPTTTTTTPTTTTTTRTTTQPTTTTTSGPGPDPRCYDGSTTYWPHPVYCSRYIECFLGDSYEMACPPGRFFSASQKMCVSANDSECCAQSSEC